MASYWYVREHRGRGFFHLVEESLSSRWREQPAVRAICRKELASEGGQWEAQYEGGSMMIGWPICGSCNRLVDPTARRWL